MRHIFASLSLRRSVPSLGLLLAAAALGLGPCGPLPGGALSGEEVEARVEDWSFVNDVRRCAVEMQPSDPYSVTLNCMAMDRRLFVSCSNCAPKRWSVFAQEDPQARIRIGERVYPVDIRRVEDPDELDSVWQARGRKLEKDADEPRPDGWWTFELTSR